MLKDLVISAAVTCHCDGAFLGEADEVTPAAAGEGPGGIAAIILGKCGFAVIILSYGADKV